MAKSKARKAGIDHPRLQVEYVAVDWLHPNEYNPNRQTQEEFQLLKRSIREDGFIQPIVARRDGTIVDGKHRWRAARPVASPRGDLDSPMTGAVLGLDSARSQSPPLARRVFIMLESQAKIVDRALGPNATEALVKMCRERLQAQG